MSYERYEACKQQYYPYIRYHNVDSDQCLIKYVSVVHMFSEDSWRWWRSRYGELPPASIPPSTSLHPLSGPTRVNHPQCRSLKFFQLPHLHLNFVFHTPAQHSSSPTQDSHRTSLPSPLTPLIPHLQPAMALKVNLATADCPPSATVPTMMTPTLLAIQQMKAINRKTPYQPHNGYKTEHHARQRFISTLLYLTLALIANAISLVFYIYLGQMKHQQEWLFLTLFVVSTGLSTLLAILAALYYRTYKRLAGTGRSSDLEKGPPLQALGRRCECDAIIASTKYFRAMG
jgi:hypothetical protein